MIDRITITFSNNEPLPSMKEYAELARNVKEAAGYLMTPYSYHVSEGRLIIEIDP